MVIRIQNVNILHLNATYTNRMTKGSKHTVANMEKPAVINSYMASKNRRKSNRTLPPFSCEYSDNLLEYSLAMINLFGVTILYSGQTHLGNTIYKVIEFCIGW